MFFLCNDISSKREGMGKKEKKKKNLLQESILPACKN